MTKQVLHYHDVQLYESDVALVTSPGQWLNDNIINFYLQYLTQTRASSDVLLMDPAVVSCLLHQCEDEEEYVDLAKGLDLTTRRVCIIPVSDNDKLDGVSSHWSLLLYCDGSFRHLDSSAGHNKYAAQQVANSFVLLLKAIGKHHGDGRVSEQVEEVVDTPQQQNGYDCGIYVLLLAEYFCTQDEETTIDVYVTPERATKLRLEMPRLIEKLKHMESI